ncbi:hypothetical protein [Paraburkholderia sacchari]|uniref:hypothetical protein n=1 Tax=Paraburkholderia sacchari TaxID=159450 RepID=UPI003D9630CD
MTNTTHTTGQRLHGAATEGASLRVLTAQESYTPVRNEPRTLDTTRALLELEQATHATNALDALVGVQLGGAGAEPESFYVIAAELAEAIRRRLDAAHRAIGGGGIAERDTLHAGTLEAE